MDHRIIRAKTQLPVRDLIEIPYNDGVMTSTLEPFGPKSYMANVKAMANPHAHPQYCTQVNFRPASTGESVAIASYMFGDEETFKLKETVFNPNWLQAGRIVRTQDGVWTNPKGQFNEDTMKRLIVPGKKVGGIYLLNRNTAFVPYESFKTGAQSHDEFLKLGLARAIEHTLKPKAEKLEAIANNRVYPNGVLVWGFESTSEPTERVLGLDSGRNLVGSRLIVDGDSWNANNIGYAFGVLDASTSESASETQK